MQILNTRYKKISLFIGDVILIIFASYLAVRLRLVLYDTSLDIVVLSKKYSATTPYILLIYIFSFYIFDLYNLEYKYNSYSYLIRFLIVIIVSSSFIAIMFYLILPWKFGRGIYVISVLFVALFTYLWRLIFQLIFVIAKKPRMIGIMGAGYAGRTIYEVLSSQDGFTIKGLFDDDINLKGTDIGTHSVLGDSNHMMNMAKNGEIDSIVLAITHRKSKEMIKHLVECKMRGIQVDNMPSLYEELTGKVPVIHLEEGWFVYTTFQGLKKGIYKTRIKRILDFIMSFLGLIALSPIIIITLSAIKLTSKGPVFFRQKRVGFNGKEFEIIKFRSMIAEAEKKGAVWASEDDPRVTNVGRIIRKLRIDEIPQMWNVIKGEMSFVGPRPERPEFIKELSEEVPFYKLRHSIKPGITGWAQVNYHYGASKEDALEKLQYDVYYIKNLSFVLDLHIILRTIKVMLFRLGAR